MKMRLRLNPITCNGSGLCAELFPERIRLDDWGYPIIDAQPIPVHELPLAHEAVKSCPRLALRLEADAA